MPVRHAVYGVKSGPIPVSERESDASPGGVD